MKSEIKIKKPFLKWAGRKTKLMPKLLPLFKEAGVFVEPFVGSGAVWINTEYDNYVLCDVNKDLINLYNILKQEGRGFIAYCKEYFTLENREKERYYQLRTLFNNTQDTREKSALFVYLNRHCFNGLCRYNSKNEFNVPQGSYKTIYFPEKEMLEFHEKSQRAEFKTLDFRELFKSIENHGAMVYCDPPYIPLSKESSFTAYSKGGFSYEDQKDLKSCAEKSESIVVISNSDTELTRRLYSNFEMITVEVNRSIGSKAASRKKVTEIIAIN